MIEFDRAQAIHKIRTTLGWSAASVAERLGVSPRMVGMWETSTKQIPEGRWRHFILEVRAELEHQQQLMVVVADDGMTPLDVVSDTNYFSHTEDADKGIGTITSYALNRMTGQPYLHTQAFLIHGNEHVLKAARQWRTGLEVGASTGEREMLAMHRWLTRRVLEAEQCNPRLRELKDEIGKASRDVDLAADAPETERIAKLRALDAAVYALIREAAEAKDGSQYG